MGDCLEHRQIDIGRGECMSSAPPRHQHAHSYKLCKTRVSCAVDCNLWVVKLDELVIPMCCINTRRRDPKHKK